MNTALAIIGYVLRGILWCLAVYLLVMWLHIQIDRTKP